MYQNSPSLSSFGTLIVERVSEQSDKRKTDVLVEESAVFRKRPFLGHSAITSLGAMLRSAKY
jgi:hypothetical protein